MMEDLRADALGPPTGTLLLDFVEALTEEAEPPPPVPAEETFLVTLPNSTVLTLYQTYSIPLHYITRKKMIIILTLQQNLMNKKFLLHYIIQDLHKQTLMFYYLEIMNLVIRRLK